MSYEDMLLLTEDQLAEQGVTKGARHKLALSIAKLQQRYNALQTLENSLQTTDEDGNTQSILLAQNHSLVMNILDELKTILATPMKPSQENDPQDIPAQFANVFEKCMYKDKIYILS
jgi:hypothetical protein